MTKETNRFLEASLEAAEVIADSLIDSEIIKSIPVVGTALKVLSGTRDLRDKIFVSKIQRFLLEIEHLSKEEILEFNERITSDEEAMRNVGETTLLVLDKLSDIKKAELLGFYYSCFLSGHLDQYQFKRIAAAIDTAFIDDIELFLKSGLDEILSQKQFMKALFSSGMTVISAGKSWNDTGELFYEASSIGRHIIELWKDFKQS
ncbi:hypothetical protein [Thalassotalea maritima]|uniref:hypothetical protein n=1 Tax=Thalassotalea maritima TaxID=3242416 RepID=UPI003528FCA9